MKRYAIFFLWSLYSIPLYGMLPRKTDTIQEEMQGLAPDEFQAVVDHILKRSRKRINVHLEKSKEMKKELQQIKESLNGIEQDLESSCCCSCILQ